MNTERINVLWDIENCAVPSGVAANQIAGHIRNALANANLHGPITLSAYGDVQMHSKSVQQALADTNIYFKNIPNDRKEAADKAIIVDIFLWALDNPPLAHIFLISGDRDFSNALHGLKNRRYNVLLAALSGLRVSQSLTGAASTIWDWGKLARGQFVTLQQSDFALFPAKDKLSQPVSSPTASAHSYQIRNLNLKASAGNHSSNISTNIPKQLNRPSGSISEHQRGILGVADAMTRAHSVLETSVQQQLRTPAFVEPTRNFQLEGHSLHGVRRGPGGITEEHRMLLQITMDSLRDDAVMPSREHIHIRFHEVAEDVRGVKMHPQSPEFELLLHAALMQQFVECVPTLSNNGDVYFLHGGLKWKYQDPLDDRDPYEPLLWEVLLIFLQRDAKTQNGAILKCQSRLQAAELIKAVASHHLQSLPVGVLMHLLQLAARKNWIVTENPASRLWGGPMSYNLPLLTYHTKNAPTPKHAQQGPLIPDLPRNQQGGGTVSASPLLVKPYKEQKRLEAVCRVGAPIEARKGSEEVAGTSSLSESCLPTPKATSRRVPVKSTGSRSEVAVNVELEFRQWLAQSFGSKGKLRGGVVLGSLMSLFKAASGLAVDWKSWGFPRASVFLQEYPDLILVSTSPSPGKVVPATCEARIDLEALLGQVVPAGGKQGLPLKLLPVLFWNTFGYSIDKKLGEGQDIRAVLEAMTQVVEVREEGAEVVVHQASGDATWRFCKAVNGVGRAGGKSTMGAQSGRALVAASSSVAVVPGGGGGGAGQAGQQEGVGILGRRVGTMTWQQKLMVVDQDGSQSKGKGAESGGEGRGASKSSDRKDEGNSRDVLLPPHTESTKVEEVASEREEGQGRERMEKGTGDEEHRGDEGNHLTERDTGETFFAVNEGVIRARDVEERQDDVKEVETKQMVEVGGSSDSVAKERGGLGSGNVAGEVEKPISIETQRIVMEAREDDRVRLSELDLEELKMVMDEEQGREKERAIEVPFASELTPNAGISNGGGSPIAVEHPLGKLLGLFKF